MHVAWSGNHVTYAERLSTGAAVLGGGELLLPGEITLAAGESYTGPWVYAAHGIGLDGVAGALPHSPARPPAPPAPPAAGRDEHLGGGVLRPRPRPAHRAGRRGRRGRGRAVRPRRRLVPPPSRRHRRAGRLVRRRGRLARRPAPAGRRRARARHGVRAVGRAGDDQPRLRPRPRPPRLGARRRRPDARCRRATSRCSTSATPTPTPTSSNGSTRCSTEYPHRLPQVGPQPRPARRGPRPGRARPACTPRPLAVYRLLDELRARHPGRGDRVVLVGRRSGSTSGSWSTPTGSGAATASTRWSASRSSAGPRQLLPPELVGSHVGTPRAHTTGRTHDLAFRAGTALFGSFGIEWDLTGALGRSSARSWPRGWRSTRSCASCCTPATVVRAPQHDPAFAVHGVVAPDRSDALFALVQLTAPETSVPGAMRLPGLDPGPPLPRAAAAAR